MRIEVIIPKNGIVNVDKLMKAIDNGLDAAAAGAKVDFNTTTRTWNHRPTFFVIPRAGERTIYTSDAIYSYVSLGTRPHAIRAKNAKMLHFYASGFRAKSRIRQIRSNQGAAATSDERFVKSVNHPGTTAREFEKVIAEKWEDQLPETLQRAIDAVLK